MRSENERDSQRKRSFIEQARRSQIIEAAIAAIAEHGYANASLARIAQHAGISKGVISYHFTGKDELMEQVVSEVFAGIIEHVVPRFEAAAGPRQALHEHIIAVGEYIHGHRDRLVALSEIFSSSAAMAPKYGPDIRVPMYAGWERHFEKGQAGGEFRQFDRRAMAVNVQSAIDGAFDHWVAYPDHDLTLHIAELAEAFDRAVVADPG